MSKLIFVGYLDDEVKVSNTSNKYFFVQLGAFSTIDSMKDNMKLSNYIYMNDNNLYYVFGCITKKSENLDKITSYFKNIGYNTYVKEFNISDELLSSSVDKTDSSSDDISKICIDSIANYKEG